MKKITYFRLLLLTLVMLLSTSGYVSAAEQVIYTTGFESSDGFTAGTVYNNSTEALTGASGKQWATYFGTPSTTSAIVGAQSMQMRWYTTTASSLGYTYTNFDLAKVTKVTFKAANTNGINVIVSYSTDGGSSYVGAETFTLTTTSTEYTYSVSPTGAFSNVRLKFQLTYATAPTGTSRLYVDEVNVYGMSEAPASPTISITEGVVPAMSAQVGANDSKTITVNGVNLTGNIALTLGGTDPSLFALSTASLVQSAGAVSESVSVTYTPSAAGTHTATLTLTSPGASDVVLNLSATATWPPLSTPVATAASDISATGFTANWDAVPGATSYLLTVKQRTGAGTIVLNENFDGFVKGTTGSGASSTDVSASLDTYTQLPGWTGSRVYEAGGTIKMGASGALGYIVTPTIDLSANGGAFIVEFESMAWLNDGQTMKIYLNDNLVETVSGLNNTDYTLSSFSVPLTGGTAASTLKFEGAQAAKGRFFLENLIVKQGSVSINPIAGSPFTVSGANSKVIDLLAASSTYFYSVVANNSNVSSEASNEIEVSTLTTGGTAMVSSDKSITAHSGNIRFSAKAGERVQVYNAIGQQLINRTAVDGLNILPVNLRGIMVVKVGNRIAKVIL